MEGLMDFQPLGALLVDTVGIAFAVGLLIFLLRKSLPPEARQWYFEAHVWLVNVTVVVFSVGLSFLGAWLNLQAFQPRASVELVWRGLFSAGVNTWGYEWVKNLGRDGR